MAAPEFVYHNGKIVPWSDATLHAFSLAGKYGIGVFEGLRGYWNDEDEQLYLFRLAEHFKRYAFSQKAMRFDPGPSEEELTQAIFDLCKANNIRCSAHLRVSAFLTNEGDMVATGPVGTTITAIPRPSASQVKKGASAQISSWIRMPDNVMPARIKCNANYHNSRLASIQAKQDGYDLPILLNSRGKVSEGPTTCIFLVKDGRLITPDVASDILESITRQTVIEIAKEYLDLTTVERDVDRSELIAADEVFHCGTGAEIAPITTIDRLPVGDGQPGSLTTKLQEIYFSLVTGKDRNHPEWRTPVY
ncbi:branched-chain amino acid transaminase [Phyllobacterium zundukense]|uniref:Branched-chain-amino-acid aminotransferase n=1 Tax=Phyllobacterium zundukense TaxID=1867719 RepID=A0A2N9VYU3_9HYPH|nr:branched-chain amino acid transaminase [Phyllobacterium zundukense]ATU95243.1 branched-chain-amino-acid transaminase [Phyllobacterium zundukense]PIO44661.1 branched-chain amino acid aminotransferase [Phyllobacterium zundukense]